MRFVPAFAALRFVLPLGLALLVSVIPSARAQVDVTWTGLGADTDWNTAGNWTTSTVPASSSATARFGATGPTTLSISSLTNIERLIFESGAQAYTITLTDSLRLHGTGITNTSSVAQTINSQAGLFFLNAASAADATVNVSGFGYVVFIGTSTAGNATLNLGSNYVLFADTSTAANATIDLAAGKEAYFQQSSSAGNATIVNRGNVYFQMTSDAGSAHITTLNGGKVRFIDTPTAVSATFVTQAGGTLDFSTLGGTSIGVGSVAGAGDISLGTKTVTVGALGSNTNVSGVISGAGGSLIKTGTGALTLSGANTYTGGTQITDGTLVLDHTNALANSTLVYNVADAGTLSFGTLTAATFGGLSGDKGLALTNTIPAAVALTVGGNNASTTFSGVLSGPGAALTKAGTGTLTLSGTNTYTGGTTIAGGTLTFLNTGAKPLTGTTTVSGGATLGLGVAASGSFFSSTDITNFFAGTATGNLANVSWSASSSLGLDTTAGDFAYSASIVGSPTYGLSKLGPGTLTLSGANTFTGGTAINAGTLALGSAGALGSTGTITFGGGTLRFGAANTTDYSARFSSAANQAYALDTNGQNVTLATALTSAGGTLAKTGAGALTLTGTNTYTGETLIRNGTLAVGGTGSIAHPAANLTVGQLAGDTGTLALSGTATVAGNNGILGGDAGAVGVAKVSGGTWTNAGSLRVGDSGSGTLEVSGTGAVSNTFAYIGTVGGSTGLAKVSGGTWTNSGELRIGFYGTGTLEVSGTGAVSNTDGYIGFFSGSTSLAKVSGGTWTNSGGLYVGFSGTGTGTLEVSGTGAVSNTAGSIGIVGGSTGLAKVSGGTWTNSGVLNVGLGGTGTLEVSGGQVNAPTVSVAAQSGSIGTVSLTGGILATGQVSEGAGDGTVTFNGGTLRLTGNQSTLFDGFESGDVTLTGTGGTINTQAFNVATATALGGTGSLTKTGSGLLTLSGANTYSGGTTISGGTVQFTALNNFGTGNVTLDGGTLRWATGTTTDVSSRLAAITANAGTFDTNGNNVTFSTALVNTGGFSKNGAGTLTLSGANTTTALSLVNLGTLALAGATSSLTTPGVFVGNATAASLSLTGGATLTATTNGVLVQQLGATPITIDGTGSTLTTVGYEHFYGALNITGGGRLVSSDTANFGQGNNTTALPINVTGTGSLLDVATQLSLSLTSPGVLTIGSGGTVRVGGELRLDNGVRASTLNLDTGGTLEVGGTDGIKRTVASALNFSGGTLRVIGTALTSSVPATLSGTTTVDTNALGATWSGVLSGTGALTKSGTGILTLSGVNTYSGVTTISAGTLAMGSASALGTGAASVSSGATLDSSTYGFDLTRISGAGTLTGTGTYAYNSAATASLATILSGTGASVTKSGSGTLTLTGANTYTGGTTISAGTLAMGSAAAVGTGAASVSSGATLDSSTYGFDLTRLSGAGTLTGTGIYAYDLTDPAASLATILGGTGARVTKTGNGTLTLSGANTYTGGTTIVQGAVEFSALSNLGSGNVTLDGGTLRWATGTTTDASARLATITANRGSFDTNGNDVTFGTALVNIGGFSKRGTGTLTLTGANSTTGTTNVTFGTLALAGATSSLTAPRISIYDDDNPVSLSLTGGATLTATTSGVFALQRSSTPITIDGVGSTLTTTSYEHLIGGLTITGGGRLAVSGAANFGTGAELSGLLVSVTGTGSRLDVGTTLTLVADSGTTILVGAGGTVRADGGLRQDSSVLGSSLSLNTGGTLEVGGTDGITSTGGNQIRFYGGTLRVIGSALTSSAPATLLFGATTIDTNGLGATLSGGLGATGGLTKSGAGALTLSGANTYTGATTVNAGSLLVTGSLANTAVSVASGATLGGSGTFAGLTALASGGILAPGNSPGTITFNAGLTLAGGSILNFELGTASDLIVVGGGLLSGPSSGQVTLNFSDSGGFGAGTYTLINYATATGTSNFSTGSFSLGSTVGGYNYALGLSGNALQLTASAIPEPSTYAAIFGAAALGFAVWRRRRKVIA